MRVRHAARVLLALALCACQDTAPYYTPTIASPTYPDAQGHRPIVAIDKTHNNLHTMMTAYKGFKKLLTADGVDVRAFSTAFRPATCAPGSPGPCAYAAALQQIDILVIANPRIAVSADEASLIASWVSLGGSLLLVADHAPYPSYISELASELDLEWRSETAWFDYFTPADGSLETNHPVTLGSSTAEEIHAVLTFTGSLLRSTVSASERVSILTFPAGATYTDANNGDQSAEGWSQGLVMPFGMGRVYVSGEAAMFTAQRIVPGFLDMTETIEEVCGNPELTLAACVDQTCPGAEPACLQAFCPIGYSEAACTQFVGDRLAYEADPNLPKPAFYLGMQVTPYNEQFLLNIIHHLDHQI